MSLLENLELIVSFQKNTERKLMKNGRFEIHCKKGLWGVDAPDSDTADVEALHYFRQYYEDGEYTNQL